MDKQAYFKMMGLCKDQALKLPKGMLANVGKVLAGAGKAAINPQTYRNAYNAAKGFDLEDNWPTSKVANGAIIAGGGVGGGVALAGLTTRMYNMGEQRGAALARNQMANRAAAAYKKGLQQGAANKAAQPGFWQRLLDYIAGIFK